MKIGNVFPSRYLKAGDLDEREHTLAIKEVKLENVGQTRDQKPVLYFKGAQKGLVLNVTNGKRIAKIVGSEDTDDWRGHKITIYATETEFGGETVDCIRVRIPKKIAEEMDAENTKARKAKPVVKAAKAVEVDPDDPLPSREAGDEPDETAVDDDGDEDVIPF